MSGTDSTNGRVHLLGAKGARPFTLTNAQRAEVQHLAHEIVMQECAKVHEHYLTQLPLFVANMIADALVDRKLIPEFRTMAGAGDGEGNAGTEATSTDGAAADTPVPADAESAAQPDSPTHPDAPSQSNVPTESEGGE